MAGNERKEEVETPLAKAAETLQSVARPAMTFVIDCIPVIIEFSQRAYARWKKLPLEYAELFFGCALCFLGGSYPMVFAAFQAAEYGGINTVMAALTDISDEAMAICAKSKKDDAVDADRDGVTDVNQIRGRELLRRKTALVLTHMDPQKVNRALESIFRVWVSVMAVLTIQFARTIALSMSISKFIRNMVDRYMMPTIESIVPPGYEKWTPILTGWICKSIGMSIAWTIQTILSAISSAIAGGLMMSRALLLLLVKHDIDLGGLIPLNLRGHEETYVDEVASYVFAAVGIVSQFKRGFGVPFPLNVILYPLQLLEYYIRWAVTK